MAGLLPNLKIVPCLYYSKWYSFRERDQDGWCIMFESLSLAIPPWLGTYALVLSAGVRSSVDRKIGNTAVVWHIYSISSKFSAMRVLRRFFFCAAPITVPSAKQLVDPWPIVYGNHIAGIFYPDYGIELRSTPLLFAAQ